MGRDIYIRLEFNRVKGGAVIFLIKRMVVFKKKTIVKKCWDYLMICELAIWDFFWVNKYLHCEYLHYEWLWIFTLWMVCNSYLGSTTFYCYLCSHFLLCWESLKMMKPYFSFWYVPLLLMPLYDILNSIWMR